MTCASLERERRLEVERILNEIVDPCSVAYGVPMGIVDMGIIASVDVFGGDVRVGLLPTLPGCIYTAVFTGEIQRRLLELTWCGEIETELVATSTVWDEDKMTPTARERLRKARDERRRRAHALRR